MNKKWNVKRMGFSWLRYKLARFDPEKHKLSVFVDKDNYRWIKWIITHDKEVPDECVVNNACFKGNLKIISLLARFPESWRSSSMIFAAANGQYWTVCYIHNTFPMICTQTSGNHAFIEACSKGFVRVAKYLAKKHTIAPNSLIDSIENATLNNHLKVVLYLSEFIDLLKNKVRVYRKCFEYAAQNGNVLLFDLFSKKLVGHIDYLSLFQVMRRAQLNKRQNIIDYALKELKEIASAPIEPI